MLLVYQLIERRGEESTPGIYGQFETKEQFMPLPPGEFRIFNVTLDKDGWPQTIKRRPKGHLKVTAPELPPHEVKIIG